MEVFMKKILAGTIFFTFTVTSAFAGQSNYGCGLGTLVFGEKNSLFSQTLTMTTNQLTFTQFFGITSGTSNCSGYSGMVYNEKAEKFVAENMDNLASDIARGNGDYLTTLGVLLEVSEKDRTRFNSKLHNNFSKIYTSESVTHKDVLKNIETVVKS